MLIDIVTMFQAGSHLALRVLESSRLKVWRAFMSEYLLKFALIKLQMSAKFSLSKLPVPCQLRAATGYCSNSIRTRKRAREGELFIN